MEDWDLDADLAAEEEIFQETRSEGSGVNASSKPVPGLPESHFAREEVDRPNTPPGFGGVGGVRSDAFAPVLGNSRGGTDLASDTQGEVRDKSRVMPQEAIIGSKTSLMEEEASEQEAKEEEKEEEEEEEQEPYLSFDPSVFEGAPSVRMSTSFRTGGEARSRVPARDRSTGKQQKEEEEEDDSQGDVFFRMYSEQEMTVPVGSAHLSRPPHGGDSGGLLEVGFDDLMKGIVDAAGGGEEAAAASAAAAADPRATGVGGDDGVLWVDRYSPRSFVDLISDGSVNRAVLKWLSKWKTEGRAARPQSIAYATAAQGAAAADGAEAGARESSFPAMYTDIRHHPVPLDENGLPTQKLLIVSGPPGAGKTTLASVAAEHAGFRPMEINASDDRNARKLIAILKSALSNQVFSFAAGGLHKGVSNANQKPNCLILDEIDGADGTEASKAILRFINPPVSKKGKKTQSPRKPGRPIICLCNDVYSTAVRPLKPFAHVLQMRKTDSHRLVCRLKELCVKETVVVDNSSLQSLASKTSNDIRSCLHGLEFLKASRAPITAEQIAKAAVGAKDMTKSLYDLWGLIFHRYVRRKNRGSRSGNVARKDSERQAVEKEVFNCPQLDKLVEGLHEFYLDISYNDPLLDKTIAVCDWMGTYDYFETLKRRSQIWALNNYTRQLPLVYHANIASNDSRFPKLGFPSLGYQLRQEMKKNLSMAKTVYSNSTPRNKAHLSELSLVLEYFPTMLDIISSPLRAGSLELLPVHEAAYVKDTVNTMVEYGLKYSSTSGPSNLDEDQSSSTTVVRLEPPLESIFDFVISEPLVEQSIHRKLNQETRQFILHLVDTENVKNLTRASMGNSTMISSRQNQKRATLKGDGGERGKKKRKVGVGIVSRKSSPSYPFRAKLSAFLSVQDAGVKKPSRHRKPSTVLYRYHEGHSNAVRRPLYMADFL